MRLGPQAEQALRSTTHVYDCCVARRTLVSGRRSTRVTVICPMGPHCGGVSPCACCSLSLYVQVCMDARIMPAAVLGLKEGCVGANGSACPPTASWSLPRGFPRARCLAMRDCGAAATPSVSTPANSVPFFPVFPATRTLSATQAVAPPRLSEACASPSSCWPPPRSWSSTTPTAGCSPSRTLSWRA